MDKKPVLQDISLGYFYGPPRSGRIGLNAVGDRAPSSGSWPG